MTRTDNLELVLNNLQSNMIRLRNEVAKRETTIFNIYYDLAVESPRKGGATESKIRSSLAFVNAYNASILDMERQLKSQTELYGKLLYTYSVLMGQDLAKIFHKN